jgi:Sulfotransferase domain
LRHPSKRAYSNYFHLVRSGIVGHSFEDVLQFHPNLVLRRSLYKDQLESYYKFIPKENIKVVIFEDLIENPKTVMNEVCSFLNLDVGVLDPTVFEIHSNRGKLPWSSRVHRLKNLFFRRYGNSFYLKTLPIKAPGNAIKRAFIPKVTNRIHGILNPLRDQKASKMNPGTQEFLDDYFKKELDGLDELVGAEVLSKWFQ